ncbi:uncharacterized protein BJ171DRAFT_139419 [Polychytrium aggregatum]|uniref:uncharacterized protein n=1 Tax=Polychytrium aggregatum TaxID=110093 RepID=UPI0022FEB9BB|nr:uncharacterized protein BJ171DRAFT_139419 [Polychytrium aggregatum]KAI9203729.1 hypothetical protein BJ171DRAFT_139419 [Polychytrium aggregatum]
MSTVSASTSASKMNTSSSELLRHRNKRRDDTIRKKVEQELSRNSPGRSKRSSQKPGPAPSGSYSSQRRPTKGTVSSLRPAAAITVLESARIVQAAQLMAAKRADAVLAINDEGQLTGILTDKDIAYRVVAGGLVPRNTTVAEVMTPNPISVYDKGSRNEALSIMVERKFRHLPVIREMVDDDDFDNGDEDGPVSNVVGLLDITKCVFERLDELEKKVNEDQNIINAMEALERRGTAASDVVGAIRVQHACPDVASVILNSADQLQADVPEVSVKASVRDAAKVMKESHQTAVLVLAAPEGEDRLNGIFTTKDIVLRVVAAGLDPATTSVVRVMTPHPDSVPPNATILEALRKLHIGHYLHLPVVDGYTPVGLVDVLTLTISMLNYVMNKDQGENTGGDQGPMWNRFWNSTFAGGDTESDRHSVNSDGQIVPPSSYTGSQAISAHMGGLVGLNRELAPDDAASQVYSAAAGGVVEEYAFKLRDSTTGKVYRFSSRFDSLQELYLHVASYQTDGNKSTDLRLSYIDDEGDVVHLSTDKDLEEAVQMARRANWARLMLYMGEPPAPNTRTDSPSGQFEEAQRSVSADAAASSPVQQAIDLIKDAPLAVNVGVSAAIVLVTAFVVSRIVRY